MNVADFSFSKDDVQIVFSLEYCALVTEASGAQGKGARL